MATSEALQASTNKLKLEVTKDSVMAGVDQEVLDACAEATLYLFALESHIDPRQRAIQKAKTTSIYSQKKAQLLDEIVQKYDVATVEVEHTIVSCSVTIDAQIKQLMHQAQSAYEAQNSKAYREAKSALHSLGLIIPELSIKPRQSLELAFDDEAIKERITARLGANAGKAIATVALVGTVVVAAPQTAQATVSPEVPAPTTVVVTEQTTSAEEAANEKTQPEQSTMPTLTPEQQTDPDIVLYEPEVTPPSPVQTQIETILEQKETITKNALEVIATEDELPQPPQSYQDSPNFGTGITIVSDAVDKVIDKQSFGQIASEADPQNVAQDVKIPQQQLGEIENLKSELDLITAGDELLIKQTFELFQERFPYMPDSFKEEVADIIATDGLFFTDDAANWPYQQKVAYVLKLYELNSTIYMQKQAMADEREPKHRNNNETNNQNRNEYVNTKVIGRMYGKIDHLNAYEKKFASEITAAVIRLHKKGYKFDPATVIAQAFLETGYGQSGLARNHNNIFGIKATDSWNGRTVSLPTIEYYNGVRTEVTAKWRVYDSIQDSVRDRIVWLNDLSYYKDAARCSDNTRDFIDGMLARLDKECEIAGSEPMYATDPSYKSKLLDIINEMNIKQIIKEASKVPHSKNKNTSEHAAGSQFPKRLKDGTKYVSQWDNRWDDRAYNWPGGSGRTISSSGCSPATQAWVIRELGLGNPTPVVEAQINLREGTRTTYGTDSRQAFKNLAARNNLKFREISFHSTERQIELIERAVNSGNALVVASGQDASPSDPAPFTSAGHVLGIYDITSKGSVKVMDPNSFSKSGVWWSKAQLLDRASKIYIIAKR